MRDVLVLRRAEIEVDVASIEKNGHEAVKCSRHVRVVPDKSLDEVKANQYDCVVIPGGNDGECAFTMSLSFCSAFVNIRFESDGCQC